MRAGLKSEDSAAGKTENPSLANRRMCEEHSDRLMRRPAARWGDERHNTPHINERPLNLICAPESDSQNGVGKRYHQSP